MDENNNFFGKGMPEAMQKPAPAENQGRFETPGPAENPWAACPPRGAYIHIPFCHKKCAYCDFLSLSGAESQINAYVDALVREIAFCGQAVTSWREESRASGRKDGLTESGKNPLASVYFGGGTPSLLLPEQVGRILLALRTAFGLENDCEITLEANPESVNLGKLCAYRALGVNRLSLGVQSLRDTILRRIGRLHDAVTALDALKAARAAGFTNLSADLMIGLPGQSRKDVSADLETLAALGLPHLSFYSLSIEEAAPFYALYGDEAARGEPEAPKNHAALRKAARDGDVNIEYAPLPDAVTERLMYHDCCDYLLRQGFRHYEISNMARPGFESRHNCLYWRGEPYYGFGLGASSYVGGIRGRNIADLPHYLRMSALIMAKKTDCGCPLPEQTILPLSRQTSPQPFLAEREEIDREEARKEFFLLGLRLTEGLDLRRYGEIFEEEIPERFLSILSELERQGLLEQCGALRRLTCRGLDFGNAVFREFV